jgi:hypothetical protein
MFAITMTFVFLALVALVGDADTLMVHYDQASVTALLGAQAGASAVDVNAIYQGRYQLDQSLAKTRCEAIAHPSPVKIQCAVGPAPDTVIATASEVVSLPIPLIMTTATVRSSHTGQAVFGDQPGFIPAGTGAPSGMAPGVGSPGTGAPPGS